MRISSILLIILTTALQAADKPNFIIILMDDMGYGDVGFNGANDMVTPNIDRIAEQGVTFSQGYTPCSVCGPSRASLMSGRYSDKMGIWGNFGANAKNGFPVDQKMLPDYLKPLGYKTGAVGKWHFGHHQEAFKPWNRNWDYFYGFLLGGHSYYEAEKDYSSSKKDVWPIHENESVVDYKKGDYLTEKFNEAALKFIEENHEDPFLLYVAYNAVHYPWSVPDSYLERVDQLRNIPLKYRRILAGMVLAVDDGVGAMLDLLEKKGIDDNTVIFFLADNGSPAGIGGPKAFNMGDMRMSSTAGLKGFKGDTYEGGVRVPFAMRWPDKLPAGQTYNYPVISMDILKTITDSLEIDTSDEDLDGVNLLPYLNGQNPSRPHDVLYYTYMNDYAVRVGDWKLTWNDRELAERHHLMHKHTDVVGPPSAIQTRLFNLAEDPFEQHDLTRTAPERSRQLQKQFDQWAQQMPLDGPALFPQPHYRKSNTSTSLLQQPSKTNSYSGGLINQVITYGPDVRMNGNKISHWKSRNWIQLVCDIPAAGTYQLDGQFAAAAGSSEIEVQVNGMPDSEIIKCPKTSNWGHTTDLQIHLEFNRSGKQTITLKPASSLWKPVNIMSLSLTEVQ